MYCYLSAHQLSKAGKMTINIALATSDALVLGCDSVASAREYFLRPFGTGLQRDSKGELLQDGDGNFTMKFNFTDLSSVVTNAWGGVTKMFQIHEQPATLVAITAGTAKLNDRPTASYAADFLSLADNKDLRRARTLLMPSVSLCARRTTSTMRAQTSQRTFGMDQNSSLEATATKMTFRQFIEFEPKKTMSRKNLG